MSYAIILPVPFDILDAAIEDALSSFTNGFVDFTRTVVTNGSVSYVLQQKQLGSVGELKIRKLINEKTELNINNPIKSKKRRPTKDELELINSIEDITERHRAIVETSKGLTKEVNDLHKRRIAHLEKVSDAVLNILENDPFTWSIESSIGTKSLEEGIEGFVTYIKTKMRMSFWTNNKSIYKWISKPEQHAKRLLLTYLDGVFQNSILIFDEIRAGSGFIDVLVVFPNLERVVVELKMCGSPYSLKYAEDGLDQVKHYIDNKNAQKGYLLIFDGRARDFAKNTPPEEYTKNGALITTKIIDVRAKIK